MAAFLTELLARNRSASLKILIPQNVEMSSGAETPQVWQKTDPGTEREQNPREGKLWHHSPELKIRASSAGTPLGARPPARPAQPAPPPSAFPAQPSARPAPLGAHSDPQARPRARSPHKVCAALLLPPAGLSPRGRSASARPAATSAALRRSALCPRRPRAPSRPPALPGPVPTDLRPREAAGRRRAAGGAGTRGPGGERVARGRAIPRSRQPGSSGAARQKGARGGDAGPEVGQHVLRAGRQRESGGGTAPPGLGAPCLRGECCGNAAGRSGRAHRRAAFVCPSHLLPDLGAQSGRGERGTAAQLGLRLPGPIERTAPGAAPHPARLPFPLKQAEPPPHAAPAPCSAAPQTLGPWRAQIWQSRGGSGCCAYVTGSK